MESATETSMLLIPSARQNDIIKLKAENQFLRKKIKHLEKIIKDKDEIITQLKPKPRGGMLQVKYA